MDYEKLHKETINKLHQMVNSGKITVETACGICADFVPESEDERMVKFIKNQLFNIKKTITENYELDAKLTNAIDWLEKQGEHANFRNKIQICDKVTRNEDGVLVNLSQLNRVAKKQGEQKPSDIIPQDFEKYVEHLLSLSDGEGHGSPAKVKEVSAELFRLAKLEQNPAWSEEDERIRQDIENLIHFSLEDGSAVSPAAHTTKEGAISWMQSLKERVFPQSKKEWSKEDENMLRRAIIAIDCLWYKTSDNKQYYQNISDWLKSLKDRIQPQPKQEWSDEDETKIKFIEEELSCIIADEKEVETPLNDRCKTLYSALSWLKSLKDRYTWKPSTEQIDALDKGRIYIPTTNIERKFIDSLLEDLKKLREE